MKPYCRRSLPKSLMGKKFSKEVVVYQWRNYKSLIIFLEIALERTVIMVQMKREYAPIHSEALEVCWRMPITLEMVEPILTRMKLTHTTLNMASIFCGWRRTNLDIPLALTTQMSRVRSCIPTTQAMYQIWSFIQTTLLGYNICTVRILMTSAFILEIIFLIFADVPLNCSIFQ